MQKKAKVIHLITRLDKGGSAENTLLTALGVDKKEFEIVLVKGPTYESRMSPQEKASAEESLKEAETKGVRLVNVPFLLRRINPVSDLLALFSLSRFLAREKPAIIHTHTSKAGFLGRLAAKWSGVPIVIHTPHGHVFFGYFGPLKTKIFVFMERLASRITDRIVALTNREKEDYLLFKIADEKKFVVVNSGIDLDKFNELSLPEKQSLKRELGIPDDALVVGTVGRLVPVKGPGFLLGAAKYILPRYPNTFFVFTGDGELRKDLEKKGSELGVKEKVIFLGWRNDVAEIASLFDIFVLPSLNEGMGRVLAEAMALSRPIVASRVGGIPDLVIHGKNGFLFAPGNSKELAKYILNLLGNKDRRERMGKEGKEMVSHYSKEIMVEKITRLYKDLLIQKNICL